MLEATYGTGVMFATLGLGGVALVILLVILALVAVGMLWR
jgi:hypothetical protein